MNPTNMSSITRPKSILVATDLTDLDFLLPVAIDQARMTGAMIWLVHVIPPQAYVSVESGAYPFVQKSKEYRAAEATLAKVALELRERNLACAYEVRRWYVVDEIKASIREHNVKRLIVGTSSRERLSKLLVGSVAEELIRSLEIPVCTVGPHFSAFASTRSRQILLALSLHHDSEQSVRFAVDLAAGSSAELTLLHVAEQGARGEAHAADAMSRITDLLRQIEPTEVQPHIRIRNGEPAEEIVAECRALAAELLILSAFPASPMIARFRAGVAYKVIAQAPCPTFTLRSGSEIQPNGTDREFSETTTGSPQPK